METNETILTREVVVIDSKKKLGGIKGLLVNCDSLAVSHYIVNNASTSSALLLPFEKALAVGDTFMTVQNLDDFIATSDPLHTSLLKDGYKLSGEDVFSKTGNLLGKVGTFEFDTVHGTIARIYVGTDTSYASDAFIFFSPDFVFVDDGAPTAEQLRSSSPDSTLLTSKGIGTEESEEEAETPQSEADQVPVEVEESLDEDEPSETSLGDSEIKEFLVGATMGADVESEDGEFKISKGTVLTEELILEAEDHDALLLLTINVDV